MLKLKTSRKRGQTAKARGVHPAIVTIQHGKSEIKVPN